MKDNFEDLIKKFDLINNKGLIESDTNLKNGAGITLENLLGESGHDFCYPDYKGIEIKSIRDYPDATFDLFSSTPDSNHIFTTQWLTEKYGYPDKTFKGKKCLKGDVFCNKLNRIGMNYKFKLLVDRENEKIVLQVFSRGGRFLNDEAYWFFSDIQKKLEIKLSKLAVITHHTYHSNKKDYYTYDRIQLYTLKSFENFLSMIEKGVVCVTFKTGYYKSGKYIGKFHDHGTSFKVCKKDLNLIFNQVY